MNQPSFDLLASRVLHAAAPYHRVGSKPGFVVGAFACFAALVVVGCGSDSEYETAMRANTVAAYDDYLRVHPDGSHAAEARTHLAALVEDREWQRAQAASSADAYQQYLRGYPSGAHAHDALTAIADLSLATVPSTEAQPTAPALGAAPAAKGSITRAPVPGAAAPASHAVRPKPAAAVPPKAAISTETHAAPTAAAGVRIQLGAFGTRSGAEAAWHRLTARYPELASRTPLIAGAKTADGHDIERLQVGGFSRESASAMCAALAAKHDACLVVPSTGPAGN